MQTVMKKTVEGQDSVFHCEQKNSVVFIYFYLVLLILLIFFF